MKVLQLLVVLLFFPGGSDVCYGQKGKNKIGAYYFDGWSGTTFHITEDLKANYKDREPVWGWVTSAQKTVDEQIALASESGLDFFSFCWYYRKDKTVEEIPNNRALAFYKQSPHVKKMEYCLLVANHGGYDAGPDTWEELSRLWLAEFKHPQYLKVNKKPLLIFFDSNALLKSFGTESAVGAAFEQLRQRAKDEGLAGVTIAICSGNPAGVARAEKCGADVVTGYNYHSAGFTTKEQAIPIDSMQTAEQRLWGTLASAADKPYIPVSTVGWDPRPWSNERNNYQEKPYFTGFSDESVKNSVKGLVNWMDTHTADLTSERIGLLYAWNENGEGAWLTPGKTGLNPLHGLKAALKGRKKKK